MIGLEVKEKLQILFIGLGNPIPTFIERRIQQLDHAGIHCMLYLQYKQLPPAGLKNARYIYFNKIDKKNWWMLMFFAVQFLFNGPRAWNIIKFSSGTPLQRLKWSLEDFPLMRIPKPDIVHLQWIAMVESYTWLKQIYGCPVVASARGSQVTVYPATNKQYKELIISCFKQVDYIHCVSQSILQKCLALGAEKTKLFLNYNGIDLNVITPKAERLIKAKNDVFRLISVGGLIWRKGYLFQLQMLKTLLAEQLPVFLVIIGSGPDEVGLKYTALQMGIQDNVIFKGQLPSKEIKQELEVADIYLSTSVAEGLSNSVMEAAAAALPIVAFDCEGMDEIILQEENGFIVPFGDVQQFSQKIRFLLDYPDDRVKMGKLGRKYIEENFDAHIQVRKMLNLYSRIKYDE